MPSDDNTARPGRPPTDRATFTARLDAAVAFKAEYSRWPAATSADPRERTAGLFMKYVRAKYGADPPRGPDATWRIATLDARAPGWRSPGPRGRPQRGNVTVRLAEAIDYYRSRGAWPSTNTGLGDWIHRVRRDPTPEQARILTQALGDAWHHKPHKSFETSAREYAIWRAGNWKPRQPHPGAADRSVAESRHANWLINTRRKFRVGKLTPEQETLLDELIPDWRPPSRKPTKHNDAGP